MVLEYADAEYAEKLTRLHMASVEAKAIMDAVEWHAAWPVVDRRGVFTGAIYDCESGQGWWICVDWDGRKLVTGCNAVIDARYAPDRLRDADSDGPNNSFGDSN